MNNVKISVIMSVYNAEKYIAQAIESILQQSFKDFEFIIVNDGSTDNSLAIIKKYEEIDSQIRIIS
ncbi:MAG: glycosyltransferase family 2 protein [Francisella endosymbiont of Hyalomma scupense]